MSRGKAGALPFKAVIFDMDGVIIDSEPFWRQAEIECFAARGVTLTEAMCRSTMGLRIDQVVEYWASRFPDAALDASLADEVVARMAMLIGEQGAALPGTCEAIRHVRARGLALGLATSSRTALIRATLRRLGLEDAFDVVHSAEHESHGKPAPDVYLSTANQLGIEPGACVSVEDSPAGIESARRAGMRAVAVPDGETRDDPRIRTADAVLASLAELPGWLDGQG